MKPDSIFAGLTRSRNFDSGKDEPEGGATLFSELVVGIIIFTRDYRYGINMAVSKIER